MAENVGPPNTTADEEKLIVGSKSDDGSSSLNSTLTDRPSDHQEQINHTTEESPRGGARGLSTQNGADTESENVTIESTTSRDGTGMHAIPSDQGSNSSLSSMENQAYSNLTISSKVDDSDPNSGESSKANNSTPSIMSEKSVNSSIEVEDNSSSSTIETNVATEAEKSEDASDGTDGTEDDALKHENPEEVQNGPIDSSDSTIALAEKEVQTDLETLPEIQTEGSHDVDAAAE